MKDRWRHVCAHQMGVISLSKLIVREKGDTRDSKGIYLICQSKTEPEMYEFVCRSADERQQWIQTIRNAIISCPEEGKLCDRGTLVAASSPFIVFSLSDSDY